MRDLSVIEVNLAAIAHNLRVIRSIIGPDCGVCPVVKADGYGLGAARIAKCLTHPTAVGGAAGTTRTAGQGDAGGAIGITAGSGLPRRAAGANPTALSGNKPRNTLGSVGTRDADGANMLAVYTIDQAAELFRAAVDGPILVLMPTREISRTDEVYRGLICGRLHLSVHDRGHCEELLRLADRYGLIIPVHLEVDTGMSRGGCNVTEVRGVLEKIARTHRLRLAGIYTHFASAETDESLTDAQDALFTDVLRKNADLIPPDCVVHAANTCATLRHRAYHKQMVRIGQGWAGYGPEWIRSGRVISEAGDLMPAVTWTSRLVQLKAIEIGATVGYGATWTAERRTLVGLVPVGFADGYPFMLSAPDARENAPQVAVLVEMDAGVERQYVPVIGRINMDQLTIDLTDVAGDDASHPKFGVQVGTEIELITPDRNAPNHLVRLAELARTNPYGILCGLNPRIRRAYHQAAPPEIEVMAAASTVAVAG